MPPSSTLNDLHLILKSANPIDVLHASWEVFDLGERAAGDAAWHDGFDEIQALGAAQACSSGRALLPLPRTGRPLHLPGTPEENVNACAELLQAVQRALSSLSSHSEAQQPEDLVTAAALAEEAAEALATLRTGEP
ncbi:hypothetical protein ACTWP5_15625 [Streptomyces sp. 4N509B]|uniref:hypothetical protein n=1 Tax=Streptomyces sp. 4N509B TaxID=3457413 RepID=UPI003FCF2594